MVLNNNKPNNATKVRCDYCGKVEDLDSKSNLLGSKVILPFGWREKHGRHFCCEGCEKKFEKECM